MPYFGTKEATLEEQEASPGGAPAPLNPSHRPYSPKHKHDILQALDAWQGPRLAFCREHRLNLGTLISWEKAAAGIPATLVRRKKYTPEQRRHTVEAFFRAGMSFKRFSAVWGVHPRALVRWVSAYEKEGPQALE